MNRGELNMTFTETTIRIPTKMIAYIQSATEDDELQRNAMMLYPYIKNGTISHGRAAEILGISKLKLIDLYGDCGLPYFDIERSEIEKEIQTYYDLRDKEI